MVDDYEIVSHKEILDLKRKIDDIKKDGKEVLTSEEIKQSIDTLNDNLAIMIKLFSEANRFMKNEENDNALFSSNIAPLIKKIDTLLEQNQTVAKGIITLADLFKNNQPDEKSPGPKEMPRPVETQIPKPSFSAPHRMPEINSIPPINKTPVTKIPPLSREPAPDINNPGDLNIHSTMPPLPSGQPPSLGPSIQPPPISKKKPLFSFKK